MRHKAREVALALGADDHMVMIAYEDEGMDLDNLTSSLFSVIDRFCKTARDEAVDSSRWLHEQIAHEVSARHKVGCPFNRLES